MDFIFEMVFEIILEFLVDCGIELVQDRNKSKWVRYPVAVIGILLFSALILGLMLGGIMLMKANFLGGILIFAIGLLLCVLCVKKLRKIREKSTRMEIIMEAKSKTEVAAGKEQ